MISNFNLHPLSLNFPSDFLFAKFVTRFLGRFLIRILAGVLTRVLGRGKTINTVYSTTRPNGKILKTTKKISNLSPLTP